MFDILYSDGMREDLDKVKTGTRKHILDKIEEQLQHEPAKETRNKKILVGLKPPWTQEEPVWQLKVGEYRVFYEVDEETHEVLIHAAREKPAHRTTEEIL